MTDTTDLATGHDTRQRPGYTWLTAFGIALAATAMAVLAAIFAATGSAQTGPAVVIVVMLVTVAGLAWRFGTWAKAIAIAVSLLLVLAFLPLFRGVLFPASPLDFVPGLLVLTGVSLGVGGGAASIWHRKNLRTEPGMLERRIMYGALALVLVGGATSTLVGLISRVSISDAEGDVAVEMRDFEFPDLIVARTGDRLIVHNSDATVHDFTVPQLGIDVVVLPGNDASIDLTDVARGSYTVYCALHSITTDPDPDSAGMATTLTVQG